jgi:hypothetical protein
VQPLDAAEEFLTTARASPATPFSLVALVDGIRRAGATTLQSIADALVIRAFSRPLVRVASLRIRQNELLRGGYSVASKPPKNLTNAGGMLAAVLLVFFKADRALYGRAFLEVSSPFGSLLHKLGLLLILRLGRGSGGQKAAVDRQFSAGNETTLIAG